MDKIILLLREKHQQPEWELLFELRNGTGGRFHSALDAFALNTYPSKKYLRISYEIKSSRNDFMNEIKNPLKRDFGMSISNEFYFLCTEDFIKPDEVPENCGLMVLEANGLKIKKIAPYRDVSDKIPITTLCTIIRQMIPQEPVLSRKYSTSIGKIGLIDIEKLINKEVEKRVKDRAQYAARRDAEEVYREKYAEFEEKYDVINSIFRYSREEEVIDALKGYQKFVAFKDNYSWFKGKLKSTLEAIEQFEKDELS